MRSPTPCRRHGPQGHDLGPEHWFRATWVYHGDPESIDWDEWGRRFGFTIPSQRHRLRFTRTTLALRSVYGGHGLHLAQLSITLPDLASGRLVAPFGPASCVGPAIPIAWRSLAKKE